MEQRPIIALVGRPNVGKSTIFNRLIGRREAITSHIPGTTRDRHFGVAQWFGHGWTIVDTAGVLFGDEEQVVEEHMIQKAMREQVDVAVQEATIIALVVDVKEGVHPDDKTLLNLLRKHNKPLVILANKADNSALTQQADMFHQLGVKHVFSVSAVHGSGIGDFVDYLMKELPSPAQSATSSVPRVAFIGRPNVGKSTLVNRLLGEKRLIVSTVPGTTRDSIDVEAELDGEKFILVDTAGIRRRGKIEEGIEKHSLFRALRAINYSDIVVLLLTIEEAPTRGDAHIAMYALEAKKRVILGLNKADLSLKPIFKLTPREQAVMSGRYLRRFAFLQRLPQVFTSGDNGDGTKELLDTLKKEISAQKHETFGKQVEASESSPEE